MSILLCNYKNIKYNIYVIKNSALKIRGLDIYFLPNDTINLNWFKLLYILQGMN